MFTYIKQLCNSATLRHKRDNSSDGRAGLVDNHILVEHHVKREGVTERRRADLRLVRQELVARVKVSLTRQDVSVFLDDGKLNVVAPVGFGFDDIDLYIGVMQFVGHCLDNADDDVFQAGTIRIVM